jgi:hypothetical protein
LVIVYRAACKFLYKFLFEHLLSIL